MGLSNVTLYWNLVYSACTVYSVQLYTVLYNTLQYNTVLYSTVCYSTVQYSTVQYNTAMFLPSTVPGVTFPPKLPPISVSVKLCLTFVLVSVFITLLYCSK